jgi:hypothetical protein
LAAFTTSSSRETRQNAPLRNTAGRHLNLEQFDPPADIDSGVYCVGGTDDFGEKYRIRDMLEYLKDINAPLDYVMSDTEMEQFKRLT